MAHPGQQQPLRGLKNFIGLRRTVGARDVLHEKDGRIERRKVVRHGRLRDPGEIARDRHQHGAAQLSGFEDGRQDASAQAKRRACRP